MRRVSIVDSHTAGEPTRVVLDGGPDLGGGTVSERLDAFRARHDAFRCAVVNEPRGSDVLVGVLLCEPVDPRCAAGVIFFNNVSYLGMCGHGTIGVVATLAHLDRIQPGDHSLETPAGVVTARLHEDGRVTVRNVPSYRHAAGVRIQVARYGQISGDIAYGGNWFFLSHDHGQDLSYANVDALTEFSWRVRQTLEREGICGAGGALIDHIDLFAPGSPGADSRNFVSLPGKSL